MELVLIAVGVETDLEKLGAAETDLEYFGKDDETGPESDLFLGEPDDDEVMEGGGEVAC